MDKIAFARLISIIVSATGSRLDTDTISHIDQLLTVSMSPVPQPKDVIELMENMASGRKISAIKSYRSLTGHGLLESKLAVERVMDKPATQAA